MKKIFLAALAAIVTLTASPALAGSNTLKVGEASVSVKPENFLGIPTEELRGDYVALHVSYPDRDPRMLGEVHPLRVSYLIYSMNMETGVGQFSHAAMLGYADCDNQLDLAAVIPGLRTSDANVRSILVSTQGKLAYDLDGRNIEGFNPDKFRKDGAYRKEVMQKGTSTAKAQDIPDARSAFDQWRIAPGAGVATPLSQEDVNVLAVMNPNYSFWQKFRGSFRGEMSPDLTMTAIGFGIDIVKAAGVKSSGLDFGSSMTGAEGGLRTLWMQQLFVEKTSVCRA